MEFLKLYGAVLLVVAPCALVATGTSPLPRGVLEAGALAVLGYAIYRHRNRSLA